MHFWKILRILTTNKCNYRCIYCHNEGQMHAKEGQYLSFDSFRRIANVIAGMGFQEIRLSGGEPLANADTIRMIEWLDANSDYEVGLATNGGLLTEEIAKRLGRTKTLVTMHFPALNERAYLRVTGRPLDSFLRAVDLLDLYGVKHSFNFVLFPDTIGNLSGVLEHVIRDGKRLKLLPYIEDGFHNYSEKLIISIREKMNSVAVSSDYDAKSGISSWFFDTGAKVKLLDSPCYDHNIERCRDYGELRLLPDLSLQKCIFENSTVKLDGLTDLEIRNAITDLWSSFNYCLNGASL